MGRVRVFRSTDYGAPTFSGAIGTMIPLLDACLINGYGSNNVVSLTHSNNVVTVTTATQHKLLMFGRQTIAGANEAGYNGHFVITPTGPYTFTYNTTGVSIDTATGTITTTSTPAGWTKPFSGTNLAVYRQGAGNMRYLRIDDTTTVTGAMCGYENMTGVSTGTGQFPTTTQRAAGLMFQKSSTATATTLRDWVLIADERQFYFWVNWNSSSTIPDSPIISFGDFISFVPGDQYNTQIIGNTSGAIAGFRFAYILGKIESANGADHYVPRDYTQTGTSMACNRTSDYAKGNGQLQLGALAAGAPYPDPISGLLLAPVYVSESPETTTNSRVRGIINGLWNPLHPRPFGHGDTFVCTGSNAGAALGKTLMALNCQLSGQALIDISETWEW